MDFRRVCSSVTARPAVGGGRYLFFRDSFDCFLKSTTTATLRIPTSSTWSNFTYHTCAPRGVRTLRDPVAHWPVPRIADTPASPPKLPGPMKNEGRGLPLALTRAAAERHTYTRAGLGGPPGHSGALLSAVHENPPFRDNPKMNCVKVAVFLGNLRLLAQEGC